ncbi:tryptophanyl-tRNA synthetase-like protein [Bimuria novae-zelandiae CBS 107.79]|uniref:Tryptophan--tRNA ligase, mitochondrial n=1 Tax=Bimuria novae-zelandiae CBS 107.79 TaxID=1447943 RepID=A0A6A5V871_9PLEO|nr:tryptophanyl-tRNA synthetase-like protein [Bimuria novae-zelandiae CBS 107.79]
MFSRQSRCALRSAQLRRWPCDAAYGRPVSTCVLPRPFPRRLQDVPSNRFHDIAPAKDANKERKGPKILEEPGKTIFSGIQPTGVPHLGNYLGALRQWVKLQDEAGSDDRMLYCVVDLHAVTMPQDPRALIKSTMETYASLIAIGLDPKRSVIFSQQDVLEHTQLMWLLSCHASMGYLGRMTQWKSKSGMADDANPMEASAPNKPALKLGLFSYPVLQAADILLYRTTHVPVGEDQAQHLEFARELANSMNHTYCRATPPSQTPWEGFPLPQTILSPAKRIMSLQDPAKKMSKSDPDPRSRILITDSADVIEKKIRHALTDSIQGVSYDRELRPGVSNLIDIMYYMDESKYTSVEQIVDGMSGANVTMKTMKNQVAKSIVECLAPIRERYFEIMARRPEDVAEEMREGAVVAGRRARSTLDRLKEAMGLRRPDGSS